MWGQRQDCTLSPRRTAEVAVPDRRHRRAPNDIGRHRRMRRGAASRRHRPAPEEAQSDGASAPGMRAGPECGGRNARRSNAAHQSSGPWSWPERQAQRWTLRCRFAPPLPRPLPPLRGPTLLD
ncbi:hypothetical protein U9M48_001675 [Paspalum notatum var. saurae]|uniref:Uncharacterized protein n=1 Tax=Paspalum notatum var. saurae TaxID=547442 RepID=A0AAQ3PP95_PASNO